ncbi:MAG: GAF domain-containing protein [Vibrio sp.]
MTAQISGLIEGEPNLIANLANISALLNLELDDINWVGFYLLEGDELVLGPFQGSPACIRIPLGRGVCGTAASTGEVQRIDDVHAFAGHIACDARSNSEIVIPFMIDGKLAGVLDIDSPSLARFRENDEIGLTKLMKQVEKLLQTQQKA